MRTIDEVKGALGAVRMALASEGGQVIVRELKKIAEEKLLSDLTANGENAVRALGFQQGIGIINILPEILEASVKAYEQNQSKQFKSTIAIK